MKVGSFDLLVGALDQAGVRYLVAGGLAVNAHAYLRFTRDVVTEPFNFDQEYAQALVKPLGAVTVRFVSIPTLIRMKELAGRVQDKVDIEYLRKISNAGS